MDDVQIKVLLDALEAVGKPVKAADVADIVRWANAPDAVRALLNREPRDDGGTCLECGAPAEIHRAHCPTYQAWVTLEAPRAAAAIGAAVDAVREQHDDDFGPENLPHGQPPQPPPGYTLRQWMDPLRGVRYRLVPAAAAPCPHRWLRVDADGARCDACGDLIPGIATRL